MWALSFPIPFQQQLVAGAGIFAPFIREYMRRSGAPDDIGILVALGRTGSEWRWKNPYAHLHEPDITTTRSRSRSCCGTRSAYAETCPSSDGCSRMVLGGERAAEAAQAATGVPPAWIHATAMRSEPSTASGRDQVRPQASLDCAAGPVPPGRHHRPRAQIDVAEIYVPFSWYEPMWMEGLLFAEGGRRLEDDRVGGPRRSPATCRSTARVASCRPTRSGPRA